ncbi:hypothetical protein N9A27_07485 [Porticoccaceae bacterium]|nr:hypothetical protein [Porticoccaceae bacterium]
MKIVFKWIGITSIALAIVAGIGWSAIGPDWRALIAGALQNNNLLLWEQSQREVAFKMMDEVPWMVKSREIKPSTSVQIIAAAQRIDCVMIIFAILIISFNYSHSIVADLQSLIDKGLQARK